MIFSVLFKCQQMEKVVLTGKELYELVWSNSLKSLSRKYNISDNGLRKICKKNNIPLPKIGYWQKLQYGKAIEEKIVPKNMSESNKIELQLRNENEIIKNETESTPLSILEKEIIGNPNLELRVPEKLMKPDKLISNTISYADAVKRYRYGHGTYPSAKDVLTIDVTEGSLQRAYRIMDTLIKLLRARNHEVAVANKAYVIIEGEKISFRIRERRKVSEKRDDYGRNYEATGILVIIYGKHDFSPKEIKDDKIKLEEKLAKVLALIELEGKNEHLKTVEREEYWRKKVEYEQILKEKKVRKDREFQAFKKLLNEAVRWDHSRILRAYLEDVERKIYEKGNPSQEQIEWLNWAKQKADWFDPMVKREDELLEDLDRLNIISS